MIFYQYIYDAWNRLVFVKFREDSAAITVQESEYDALGRRIRKKVTFSGTLDAETRYYYDGQKIIETRVGGATYYDKQFIHGTQYIDELLMMRVKDKGELYIHQDANWNVIGMTDMGGNFIEEYTYSPYGEPSVNLVRRSSSFGDYDGDLDTEDDDYGTYATPNCSGTATGACRILDLDFDGDVDQDLDPETIDDYSTFASIQKGFMHRAGGVFSYIDQPLWASRAVLRRRDFQLPKPSTTVRPEEETVLAKRSVGAACDSREWISRRNGAVCIREG